MRETTSNIKPLDPEYGGESNYERGVEDLLTEAKERLKQLRMNPETTTEQLGLAEEEVESLESLRENYYEAMNVFRQSKGGRAGLREEI